MPTRISIAVPWFQRRHYDSIRQMLSHAELPLSFDLWEIEARRRMEEMSVNDIHARPIVVTPDDLQFYCELRGITPTLRTCDTIATLELAKDMTGHHGAPVGAQ